MLEIVPFLMSTKECLKSRNSALFSAGTKLSGPVVFIPRAQPHAQSLFLFPIVFGINLIQFFIGKNKIGLGKV